MLIDAASASELKLLDGWAEEMMGVLDESLPTVAGMSEGAGDP